MAATFYYASGDENRVLTVDQLSDHTQWTEELVAKMASAYPETIYFKVDNTVPEFRVPLEVKRVRVSDLDGSVDAADWISEGHILDSYEVEYLRSLIIPEEDS